MDNLVLPELDRFDFTKRVMPMSPLLRPVAWALSALDVKKKKGLLTRVGMEDMKPPYLLLVNHNSFYDFKAVTMALFPSGYNNVVAIDGFLGREWLLRAVGCICKRKFTNDLVLIRQMLRVVKRGDVIVLYPEARYSLCGTTAVLPTSLARLVKLLNVPVAVMINHGHHLMSPFWNLKERKVQPESVITKIVDASELRTLSTEEIARRIEDNFRYDDFAWQKETGRIIDEPFRAEGLHKVLYQCPACGAEYHMASAGAELYCESCGKRWTMTELGELRANEGETAFSHIPDWYEWERANVRREVESGEYRLECDVLVHALPNADRFVHMGKARFIHDCEGFRLEGGDYSLSQKASAIYSVHIEYEYLGKYGDCIDMNTDNDTMYLHPVDCLYSVTKVALAVEELYKLKMGTDNLFCLPENTEARA